MDQTSIYCNSGSGALAELSLGRDLWLSSSRLRREVVGDFDWAVGPLRTQPLAPSPSVRPGPLGQNDLTLRDLRRQICMIWSDGVFWPIFVRCNQAFEPGLEQRFDPS